jgi:hypothetical protein
MDECSHRLSYGGRLFCVRFPHGYPRACWETKQLRPHRYPVRCGRVYSYQVRIMVAFLFLTLACFSGPLAAQQSGTPSPPQTGQQTPQSLIPPQRPPTLPTGTLLPKVAAIGAPGQTYALYLPAQYSTAKRWPVVYVLAPDARGEIPAAIMQSAAEQFGYIIAASNNSKNGPWAPDAVAAQTLFNDTRDRLAIDERRIYFAGFSGGARVAAQLAQSCKCAQAVFLNGAGFSTGAPPTSRDAFGIFVTAGLLDFNYPELVTLDGRLETLNFAHFLRRFDGSHQWAPAEIWLEVFAWADLLAIKTKHKDRDDAFIAGQLANFSATAQNLEQGGDRYLAWQFLRATDAAFSGLADLTALEQHASALENNPAVRTGQKREKEAMVHQQALEDAVYHVFGSITSPSADRSEVVLQTTVEVVRLRDRAAHENNTDEYRVLERARRAVFAYFIESGEPLMNSGDPRLARIYIALAAEARPESAWPQLALARCDAKMGRKKDAVRELQKAVSLGLNSADVATLASDYPEFAAISAEPEFQKMVAAAVPRTQ